MPIMNWDQSLDIGVEAMNAEHREILDLMNKIYDARAAGRDGVIINGLVSQLGVCCTKHFADEERYMAQIGYPELESHKLLHKKLLLTFGEHAAQIKDAGGKPTDAFFNFLKFWLSSHIKGIDTKYAAHAGAKGR
ncbi:MAG: bacteriohemerythrin [Caulobacteraceae bacterium]